MEFTKELTIPEKQKMILEVMKDIDRFCRENGIRYSLSSGTLLGSVRHKGFIPWDDDGDLEMLREDFDRFVKTYKSDKYILLYNSREDNAFFASGYAKVCDPTTVSPDKIVKYNPGIFVDIFPIDPLPEDENERKIFVHKLKSLANRLYHRQRKDIISILKSYRHSLDWWWNKLDKTVRDPKYADSPIVGHIIGSVSCRAIYNRNFFDNLEEKDFEDCKFYAFKDSDEYLTRVFGADYMTPRKWNHNTKVYLLNEQNK